MARHKLDNLGYVKYHSGLMNSDERMRRMKNCSMLSASLADIKWGVEVEEK